MPAAIPVHPLYPVACFLSSVLLLFVFATTFVRQSWNLGLTSLCFWLFWETLTDGINAVVWSDNYNIKLEVYCDIVSRVQLISSVVKPICTLVIVRRLHLIVSLCSVELPSCCEKYKTLAIEWTLCLIVPLTVAGPLYYIVEVYRFEVIEGFGCGNATDGGILTTLLITSRTIVPPLISVLVYYPKVVLVFYRRRRDTNRFLESNNSISRTNYFRILALASIDILFTLPVGIANLTIAYLAFSDDRTGRIYFYEGWDEVHSVWNPVGISYTRLESAGIADVAQVYLTQWTSPFLAFIVFGLFGYTAEARTTYWRAVSFVGKRFGWKPTRKAEKRTALGTMEFGVRSRGISLDAELDSRPSFVNFQPIVTAKPESTDGADKGIHASEDFDENGSSGHVVYIEHQNDRTTEAAPPHDSIEV